MAVSWGLIYLVILALFGFGATMAILARQRRSIVEVIGLSLLLGPAILGASLILLSLFGLRPTRVLILLLGMLSIAWIIIQCRKGSAAVVQLPQLNSPGWKTWALIAIPMLLLFGANLAASIPTVSFDYFEWDAAVIWGFKAKVLYEQPLLWHSPDYFHDTRLSFSHIDYPLLWPMIVAGAYGVMGHPSEQLGKIVIPMLFAGQSLLAYSGARVWLGRFGSLMLAVLFVGSVTAIIYATHGSADSALTAFYLGAVIYLIRWIMLQQRSDIILAGLFTGFVASTKTEGLPLAMIHLMVLLGVMILSRERKNWKDFGIFALIVSSFIIFWIAWRIGIPHTNDNYTSRLSPSIITQNIGRVGTILTHWKNAFLNIHDFGLLWILLPIMAAIGFRAFEQRESQTLWLLLILHLSLYMLVYIITDWNLDELFGATRNRLLMHVSPIVMLLIAAHWRAAGRILPAAE